MSAWPRGSKQPRTTDHTKPYYCSLQHDGASLVIVSAASQHHDAQIARCVRSSSQPQVNRAEAHNQCGRLRLCIIRLRRALEGIGNMVVGRNAQRKGAPLRSCTATPAACASTSRVLAGARAKQEPTICKVICTPGEARRGRTGWHDDRIAWSRVCRFPATTGLGRTLC